MKKTISILLAILMVLTALPLGGLSAFAATSGDFEYSVLSETDKTCEITKYKGSAKNLDIPSKIDGYTMTSIGVGAFRNCASLTSITIPDSVTSIIDFTFEACISLTSITIPNSVTSIGAYAFVNCTSLTSITIPDSVTEIGYNAFGYCTSLTSITIPNSVTSIGNHAFWGCTSLTSVILSNSVTSIGDYAFRDCTSLTSITIPNSVTSIGKSAFYNCTSLTSITIPDSVTSIGAYAFLNCTSLTSITIPDSVTSIGDYAFGDCTSLTSITIPNSVTSIGNYAFRGCTSLTSVILSNSVTSIGYYAFGDCTSLTSITIPDSVTYIDRWAFSGCTPLKNISVDAGNENYCDIDGVLLNKDATRLIYCPAAKSGSYTIPDSVTSIGDHAFDSCVSLTSITIPDSVTSIGVGAFRNCTSLTSITIPDSVTSIVVFTFEVCTSLTSITIPDSVTSIGGYAFASCTSFTSITIPDSVTSIGDYAFRDCTSLTSITIPDSVTRIEQGAFEDCTSLTSVTIPDSVTSIEWWAFDHCTALERITLPNSVTRIDDSFYDCTSLTTIYGYSGSYAERYAETYGYTFIDISTGIAATAAFTQNEITLSLFDKDAFIEGNVDFFGEHSTSAQHRLNDVRLTAGSTQQDFDSTAVLNVAQRGETVALSKNDYQKYTVPAEVVSSWFESDALAARNIYMTKDKKDGKPYISGAYAKENGKSVAYTDLQSEALTVMADTAYDILLTAETNSEAVQEYVLSQDDAHKLTSKNGVFSAKTLSKTFAAGKDVYAYVKTASGKTSAPVKVGLQITQLSLNTDTFSLVGQKGQTLTFAKDAPLVGNASLSLDGFTFPLGLEVEGNRFKISFGIDLFSVKKENDQLWGEKDGTKTWDFFKTNVRDLTSSVDSGTEKLKKFNNFYKTLAPNQSYNNKSQNFDTSFLGYAEGYLVDGKLVYTDFCGEVAAKFSFNYTQQGTIWVIPVYAYVKAGASAAIQLQSVRTLPDKDVPFDFGINLNITPSLTLGGGVGVKGAVSGGLYGKGSLPVAIQFMQQHANVKLTGEIGIEGECFCFSGKKTLVDGTITLCDKYYGKAKTAAVQNVLQRISGATASDNAAVPENGTVTAVMPRDYAENTSKWLGTDYFKRFFAAKSTVADGLSVKELQTSVFKNSQTQLITLDNGKMMMAWIEDDSARDTYNRMRLVYSIYENGSWSKPKAVSDDGTNDAYPSLATDGTTVYIAWQNLKRSLTKTDADSIDAILKNSEICIAKYNAAKNQFENEKTLTNNVKYDYSPSLAVENAQAALYWVQSSDNNLSTAGSNTLYRYTTTDGTTTAVKSGLNYMPDMECAFVNGKDEVAFSMDTDGDLTTTGDIFAYTLANGILTQQTPNDETRSADFAVTYGMLNGQNTLFFADSTDVYYKQNGTVKKVFTSPRTVCGDLQVVENGKETNLLWTEISEAGTELWQCRCTGGVWSEPVQISNIGALLHDVSVVYHNGIIHGVFDRTVRTQENGEYVSGQTDLCYMTLTDYTDLEVSLVAVDESTFTVGETAEIPVYLKNNGTQDISSVDLTLRDTLGTEITVNQAVDLPSGMETVVYVSYGVPQNYGQTTLTATAGVPNTEDINSANNTDSLEIGYANIAVSEISVNDVGEYFVLSATVTNRNPISVKNVQVEIHTDDEKGKLLELATLGDLQSGEMRAVQYIVMKSALQYDANHLAKICFLAKTDSEEKMTADNVSYAVLENRIAEPNIQFGDIDGNGEIDDWDSVLLDRYLAGWEVEINTSAADMDENGTVDDWDGVLLARKLAGWN